MSNERFIDGLVATAAPVGRRQLRWEIVALAAVALLQIVGSSFYFGVDRVVANIENGETALFMKLVVFGVLAFGSAALALASFYPTAQKTLPYMTGLFVLATLLALFGLDHSTGSSVQTTLYPTFGRRCLFSVLSLSLPITLLLGFFLTRGASTHLTRSSLLVGVAGGSWGAFAYALQCPFSSVWYVGVWYLGAVALITLAARLILPRIAKW